MQQAWLTIPHGTYAEKGYGQTGPTMPLQGPIRHDQVFKDLLRVWEIIDPSTSPTQVGTKMRDDAIEFVNKGYADGKWKVWADCHKLIDEQDGVGDATPEGMEAFSFETDGKDSDDDDGDGEGDDGGGPDETFGDGPDEPHGPDIGDDYDEGDDGSEGGDGPGGGTDGVSPSPMRRSQNL